MPHRDHRQRVLSPMPHIRCQAQPSEDQRGVLWGSVPLKPIEYRHHADAYFGASLSQAQRPCSPIGNRERRNDFIRELLNAIGYFPGSGRNWVLAAIARGGCLYPDARH